MKTGFWSRARQIAANLLTRQTPQAAEMLPAFIVGCGHSGTSILLRIMGAHSRIHAIRQESSLATSGKAQQMLRQFDIEAERHRKLRWIEKTPLHIHHIKTLLSFRKGARILLLIRDGRDVIWSIKEREGSLDKGIERWINDNRAGEPFWTHPQVHVIRYEALVSETEATIRAALDFLGESFEPSMLDYHLEPMNFYSNSAAMPPGRTGEFHRQFRNWQINQPLFDGRERWKQLSDHEKTIIKLKAGEMLTRYGYGLEPDW